MNRQPTNGFKKGHKKIEGSGRQPGQPNRLTQDMKEALLAAATRVGFIHEDDILDKDGKPTGRTKKRWNGEGGLEGYLEWAAVYRSSHIISLLGRVMPLQVNVKADVKPKRVPYPSYEAICDDLRAKGIDPDVLERSMEPKFIQEQRKKEELRAALRERGIDPDILEAAPDVIAAIGAEISRVQETGPGAVKLTDGARPAGWGLRPGGIGFFGWLLSNIYLTSIFDDAHQSSAGRERAGSHAAAGRTGHRRHRGGDAWRCER